MKTLVMNINTENPNDVCEAIDELCRTYKNIKIITIIKEKLNNWVFYQIGN